MGTFFSLVFSQSINPLTSQNIVASEIKKRLEPNEFLEGFKLAKLAEDLLEMFEEDEDLVVPIFDNLFQAVEYILANEK